MSEASQGRETLTLGVKAKIKQAAKSGNHERILDVLKGEQIALVTMDGCVTSGKLLGHDRYTITFQEERTETTVTIFKHAIRNFNLKPSDD